MAIWDKIMGATSSTADEPPAPVTGPQRVATAETSVRNGFIRKVYSLLTINFLITIGVSVAFSTISPISEFLVSHSWVMFIPLVISLALLIVLSCFKLAYPINLIVMYVFVLAYSAFVGCIVAIYFERGAGPIVLQSFIATAAVFLSITLYVAITKQDFRFLYGFLAAGIVCLIVLSLSTFVIRWFTPSGKLPRAVYFAISVFGYVFIPFFIPFLFFDATSQRVTNFHVYFFPVTASSLTLIG